ncbi:2'-5' RNA ligase family protein [Streptomyces sp. NPDC058256]|uniref:2'-5' RNA ligase family protein n=1 Tax=Streptomyces sp. NPDC058256 TaxID=3346408 RepID=UPI0036E47B7A
MENFFDRVERVWPQGRRDLHWHVLPALATETVVLGKPYVGITLTQGLHKVIPEWMHCTLVHAIGADVDSDPAVSAGVELLVADVTERVKGIEPFTLTFGRPDIGQAAIEAPGWPGRQHRALVGHVMAAHRALWGEAHQLSPSRYPHISLAYAGEGAEEIDVMGLKAQLSDIEGPQTADVYVDRLHLVAQRHDGGSITWQPLAEVRLKGADDEAHIDSLLAV